MEIFHTLIFIPIYNLLVFLYDTVTFQDFGLAIIATTFILKLVLFPLSKKQIESQKQLQDVQPKIKAIQKKYKDDKERQAKELMAFYKDNKVNPFGGCLPLIVQIVFLLAIYRIILVISEADFVVNANELYSFVSNPETINPFLLGLLDLSKASVPLAIITAIAQYWQMKMIMGNHEKEKEEKAKKESAKKKKTKEEEKPEEPDMAAMMQKQMLYIGPLITMVIGASFPAGLTLYWFTSTVFMIAQQKILLGKTDSGK